MYLRIELTNSYGMAVKTQLYLCAIQGVSVCTNVLVNYMFRPLPVRPSSGWTQRSEELYNNALLSLKSGGQDLVYNIWGMCAD